MEESQRDTVLLEIQGTLLQCNRHDLIKHSDYFKAMFEGNFVESYRNFIPLKGVELVAMNTILKLLWDREYIIEEENILSVLRAACMLQFLEIKEICIERIQNTLNVRNCLKIWFYTDQLDLKLISNKAKLLALMEFMCVKETDYFLELNLNEILNYLGNINLQCPDEFVVFQSLLKWYQNLSEKDSDILLQLLYCLDFTKMTDTAINEIISHKSFVENDTLINTLKCLLNIKYDLSTSHFQENFVKNARSLLKSKSRNAQGFPCILVDKLGLVSKNSKVCESTSVFYYDKFKRRRKYDVVESCTDNSLSVIYIDVKMAALKKLFDMDSHKCANLDGFKMIGYKQFVFLYGGEYLLGKGDWNYKFYMYDTISEKWKHKDLLPFPRRHFDSCICGNYLFIIGGTGPFRVIQENIFWYNLEEDKWSKEHKLPCSGRQINCCSVNDALFILNINNKCGYSFCTDKCNWSKIDICDINNILPHYSKSVCVVNYKKSIFIKEMGTLFELKFEGNHLIIANQIVLPCETQYSYIESVLCNNVLYSLNRQCCEETSTHTISLESLNLENFETCCICKKTTEETLETDEEIIKFKPFLVIFSVFHPNLVDVQDAINSSSMDE